MLIMRRGQGLRSTVYYIVHADGRYFIFVFEQDIDKRNELVYSEHVQNLFWICFEREVVQMGKKDQEARERIVKVTTMMLLEFPESIDKITVRQIAERADVGTGSINYYFGSRDSLLSLAVGSILSQKANVFLQEKESFSLSPADQLKSMLKELCKAALVNEKLIRFTMTQSILNGELQTLLYLVPLLKQIFGAEKEELELRVIALQILQPLQIAGIAPAAFRMYSGIDLYDTEERNSFIDMLVDNLTAQVETKR